MYIVVVIAHVIASLFLIAVILLQAGRGGGLADTLGGSQMQSLFGTKSASVLAKLTAVCAGMFIITSLSLAIISSQRAKSIVDKVRLQGVPREAVGVKEVAPIEGAGPTEETPPLQTAAPLEKEAGMPAQEEAPAPAEMPAPIEGPAQSE